MTEQEHHPENHIGDLLNASLRSLGVYTPVTTARVAESLRELLGPDLFALCTSISFRSGHLTVQVANASFATQLHYDQQRIIETLNERLGEGTISTFRVRQ
ncbi:MAG: DUF721 domain-containing protein [Candidatus Dormibacteria bacterium]